MNGLPPSLLLHFMYLRQFKLSQLFSLLLQGLPASERAFGGMLTKFLFFFSDIVCPFTFGLFCSIRVIRVHTSRPPGLRLSTLPVQTPLTLISPSGVVFEQFLTDPRNLRSLRKPLLFPPPALLLKVFFQSRLEASFPLDKGYTLFFSSSEVVFSPPPVVPFHSPDALTSSTPCGFFELFLTILSPRPFFPRRNRTSLPAPQNSLDPLPPDVRDFWPFPSLHRKITCVPPFFIPAVIFLGSSSPAGGSWRSSLAMLFVPGYLYEFRFDRILQKPRIALPCAT